MLQRSCHETDIRLIRLKVHVLTGGFHFGVSHEDSSIDAVVTQAQETVRSEKLRK